jgi:preprotein translocase subunit YajC
VNGLIVTEAVVHLANIVGALPPGLVAQASGPAGPDTRPFMVKLLDSGPMLPLFVIILLLWVFMFRSKRKEQSKKKEELNSVKRGDRIQTIGGILGNVVQVEKDKILLKVDESSNTKIWFSRNAIYRVIDEDKAEQAKA